MTKGEKIIIILGGLLLVAMIVLFLLPGDDQESSPIRADIDRQLRPQLEEVLNVTLVVASFGIGYSQQHPPPSAAELKTNYTVEGEFPDPSRVEAGLITAVESFGVSELHSRTVGNTAVVFFQGLTIEGRTWSGFIQAHRGMIGWYLHQ
jgi:hypothetical protein